MSDKKKNGDKGYSVRDRRALNDEDKQPAAAAKEKTPDADPAAGQEHALSIDFVSFISSIATTVIYHLGRIPPEHGGTSDVNLPLARHSIDIIAMLRDKTKGNLTEDEERDIREIVADLQMLYVEVSRAAKK